MACIHTLGVSSMIYSQIGIGYHTVFEGVQNIVRHAPSQQSSKGGKP